MFELSYEYSYSYHVPTAVLVILYRYVVIGSAVLAGPCWSVENIHTGILCSSGRHVGVDEV